MIFIWALVRWRWPLHAPKVIFFFALIECIKLNLVIRDQLPKRMIEADKIESDEEIF